MLGQQGGAASAAKPKAAKAAKETKKPAAKRRDRFVSPDDWAKIAGKKGEKIILVRKETNPEDVEGMHTAAGILTSTGGMTSHAAVVARGWGRCCVVGAGEIQIDANAKKIKIAHRLDSTPFSFVNERNQPTGYTIDICKSVVASLEKQFKVTGIEIQWVPVTSLDATERGERGHGSTGRG